MIVESVSKGLSHSAPNLHCELVTEYSRFRQLAPLWDKLVAVSEKATIFQTFPWVHAFWSAQVAPLRLMTFVVFDGDNLVAILPLAVNPAGDLQFLTEGSSDYNDVICRDQDAPNVVPLLLSEIMASHQGWKRCSLDNVPADSNLFRNLPAFQHRRGDHIHPVYRCACPTIIVEPGSNLFSHLSRKKDIRRQTNRLSKLGVLQCRHIESREEIYRQLPTFFDQHISRRASLGQQSRFNKPQFKVLYRNLADELDPSSTLRFSVLELDGKPLAYHFGFQFRGRFIRYTSVFDMQHEKYSPGEVLLGQLLHYAAENGVTEFDFGIGSEPYKVRFANHIKENQTIFLDRRPRRFTYDYIVREARQVVRRRRTQVDLHGASLFDRAFLKVVHSLDRVRKTWPIKYAHQ
jgi:CelD/BcsL family acetyltransferase involved in cellulose biosynthesis